MSWSYLLNEVESHLKQLRKELKAKEDECQRLHVAYIRLRSIIGDEAFKTPHAPTPEQVWETTEKALKARLGN